MKAGDTLFQKEAYTHADVSSTVPGVYDGKADMKNVAHLVSLLNTQPGSLFFLGVSIVASAPFEI
jgi:hypothetical protein